MKKIISALTEEILLAVCLVLMVSHSSGRMTWKLAGISMIALGSAVLVSIAVENLIAYLTDRGSAEAKILNQTDRLAAVFIINSGIFFIAFRVVEYFGEAPASIRTLVIISLMAACSHMAISRVINALVEIRSDSIKTVFQPEEDDRWEDLEDEFTEERR